jgi:ATP-dependent 26S proteasome regulatory subunit
METEVLRIIEGGLVGDKRKILAYSSKLADRLSREGNLALAKCIRQKISTSLPQGQVLADAVRLMPIDTDSHLQIVEVHPPNKSRQNIVLEPIVARQVSDFIDMVNHRSELELAEIEINKTMLLYGQPGCGKTSIAHYIAEHTGLPLIVARLDSVISSLLGSTAKNIRKIFDYANSMPCILFLDEFDAIAKARDDIHELGELKRVINSLLQNIDNMNSDGVLVAATNHPEILDRAVWRRFVQVINVGLPTEKAIEEMITIFSSPYTSDISHDSQKKKNFIKAVQGLSPSVIKNIFDRVKVKLVIKGKSKIEFEDLFSSVFEETSQDRSEAAYVCFLNSYGVAQTEINKRFGISLRKIKSYLSANN